MEQEDTCNKYATLVKEADEIENLVSTLKTNSLELLEIETEKHLDSIVSDKLIAIFQEYQEQPRLLDPLLESILAPLFEVISKVTHDEKAHIKRFNQVFRVVYTLTNVRGAKTISNFFPHAVVDLEPVVHLLKENNFSEHDTDCWKIEYILLLWLSIILMIPFDLDSIDSEFGGLIESITDFCKKNLFSPGKGREGASEVLSRLYTRPDIDSNLVSDVFVWCNSQLVGTNSHAILGSLDTLNRIFDKGQRLELIPKIPLLLNGTSVCLKKPSIAVRKLSSKLTQRLGLAFLKQKSASWRYQLGNKTLLQTKEENCDLIPDQDADDEDIAEELEEIIDSLLTCLQDEHTAVRWSAAKGIGKITDRLPLELGNDIVGSVTELISPGIGPDGWHGGCLALAELARRGLLLPEKLKETIPILMAALVFDIDKGTHSTGSHVRDAACYVAWSFARAYSPHIMEPYVHQIAPSLMIISLFDREVNCRRAGSAAFQENVGRQGNFPHGMEIIGVADYFSLGNKSDAYLEICEKVAYFEEYRIYLILHLFEVKLKHWDIQIRKLSSKSLGNLSKLDPSYFLNQILPQLLEGCYSTTLNQRHGYLLAIAEIILSLTKSGNIIPLELQKKIVVIPSEFENRRLYRGIGGEFIRFAICRLIECMSLSKIPLNIIDPSEQPSSSRFQGKRPPTSQKKVVVNLRSKMIQTIEENLKHPKEEVQIVAAEALNKFCSEYYKTENVTEKQETQNLTIGSKLTSKFIKIISTDQNVAAKRGYTLALGYLPQKMILHCFKDIVNNLFESIKDPAEVKDAETRANASLILSTVTQIAISQNQTQILQENLNSILDLFLNVGTCDYLIDNRGDVGSFTREKSISALGTIISMVFENEDLRYLISEQYCVDFVCRAIQLSLERLDRLRSLCGKILEDFIFLKHLNIPSLEKLRTNIFQSKLSWNKSNQTIPALLPLITYPNYIKACLLGLTARLGGKSKAEVEESSTLFIDFIQNKLEKQDLLNIMASLTDLVKQNANCERVSVPILKTFDTLLSTGSFNHLQPPDCEIFEQMKKQASKSKNMLKLRISCSIYCSLLLFSEAPYRIHLLQQILILLGHPFAKIRSTMAEKLISTITIYDNCLPNESSEKCYQILIENSWENSIQDARTAREQFYILWNLEKPKPIQNKSQTNANENSQNSLFYSDLVGEAQY